MTTKHLTPSASTLSPVSTPIILLTGLIILGVSGPINAGLIDSSPNAGYQVLGRTGDTGDIGEGGMGGCGGSEYCGADGGTGQTGSKGGDGGTGGTGHWSISGTVINNGKVWVGNDEVGMKGNRGSAGSSGWDGGRGGLGGIVGLPGASGDGPIHNCESATFGTVKCRGGKGGIITDPNNGQSGNTARYDPKTGKYYYGLGGGGGAGESYFIVQITEWGIGGDGSSGARGDGGTGSGGNSGTDEAHTTSGVFINTDGANIILGGLGGAGGTGGDGGQGGGGQGGRGGGIGEAVPNFGERRGPGRGGEGGTGGEGGEGGTGGSGILTVKNGGMLNNNYGITVRADSELNVESGGTLENTGTVTNDGVMTNAGTFINNRYVNGDGNYIQTGGRTIVNGEGFEQQTIDIRGGTLSGNGRVEGDTIIGAGASINPGNSPGTLRMEGDTSLFGTLSIEVFDHTVFDVLDVTGSMTFGAGSLIDFVLDSSFVPIAGLQLEFLEAGKILGFDNLSFSLNGGLMNGFGWEVLYDFDETSLALNFFEKKISGVPEPSTFLLIGLSFPIMGWLRRKQDIDKILAKET